MSVGPTWTALSLVGAEATGGRDKRYSSIGNKLLSVDNFYVICIASCPLTLLHTDIPYLPQ